MRDRKIVSNAYIRRNSILMKVRPDQVFILIDEVPIILHELNDSAIHFISRDQYERALSLL